MSDKSDQRDPFKIFNENVAQECPGSVSDQSVQKVVSFKSVKQSHKDSHKSVLQGFPIYKSFQKRRSIRVRGL